MVKNSKINRFRDLVKNGPDEEWWSNIDNRNKKEYLNLLRELLNLNSENEINHSPVLNEIYVKSENIKQISDFVSSKNLLKIEAVDFEGKPEVIILTNDWFAKEKIKNRSHYNSDYINFLIQEFERYPFVEGVEKMERSKSNRPLLSVKYSNSLKTTRELGKIVGCFGLELNSINPSKNLLVYSLEYVNLRPRTVLEYKYQKIKDLAKHYLLKHRGIEIDGKRYFYKTKIELGENNLLREELVSEENCTIENPDIESAFYYESNKDLPIPAFDWLLNVKNKEYIEYVDNLLEEKSKSKLINSEDLIKYDKEKL